ncbi:MAG: MFS transporter [Pseudomonadota bacterium]
MNKKLIAGGLIGNTLEWYDFAVYGYFAATIGHLFFPTENASASLLLSLSAFAVGFVSRPIGGILFGYIGDRMGRKAVLVYSTLMMAIPCTLIGLLPTWETIGIAAPVFLVLLRLLQGASVGGELTGSVSYLFEHAPPGRRALYASFTIAGAISGILLGSAVSTLITAMLTPDQLLEWGWRIPFVMGAAVGIAGFVLRRHMPEDAPTTKQTEIRSPLITAVRSHWQQMAIGSGIAILIAVNFYMTFIYLTTYMVSVSGLEKTVSLEINTISMVVVLVMAVVGGWLADRFGAHRVLIACAVALIALAYPLLWMIDHPNFAMALSGQIGLALVIGPYNGVFAYYIGQLFPANIRMSGFSVCYNVSFAIFGGTAPMVAQVLVSDVGPHAPAFYAMAAAAIGLISVVLSLRLNGEDQGVSTTVSSRQTPARA